MINRRLRTAPPALPGCRRDETLDLQATEFCCLLLETANMRVSQEQGAERLKLLAAYEAELREKPPSKLAMLWEQECAKECAELEAAGNAHAERRELSRFFTNRTHKLTSRTGVKPFTGR